MVVPSVRPTKFVWLVTREKNQWAVHLCGLRQFIGALALGSCRCNNSSVGCPGAAYCTSWVRTSRSWQPPGKLFVLNTSIKRVLPLLYLALWECSLLTSAPCKCTVVDCGDKVSFYSFAPESAGHITESIADARYHMVYWATNLLCGEYGLLVMPLYPHIMGAPYIIGRAIRRACSVHIQGLVSKAANYAQYRNELLPC